MHIVRCTFKHGNIVLFHIQGLGLTGSYLIVDQDKKTLKPLWPQVVSGDWLMCRFNQDYWVLRIMQVYFSYSGKLGVTLGTDGNLTLLRKIAY